MKQTIIPFIGSIIGVATVAIIQETHNMWDAPMYYKLIGVWTILVIVTTIITLVSLGIPKSIKP